jgi:hypothetical protein
VGIDFLYVFQDNFCHNILTVTDVPPQSSASQTASTVLPYDRSPHCRTASRSGFIPPFNLPMGTIKWSGTHWQESVAMLAQKSEKSNAFLAFLFAKIHSTS